MTEILIADDDAVTRALLAAAVRTMGHHVSQVDDGEKAWDEYQRLSPPLVITDWRMPLVDGLELCRRIKARDGDRTFVVLVTGRDAHEDLEEALVAGVDDYLTKPVQPAQLRARMTIAEGRLGISAARRHAEEELARMRWLLGVNQTVRTFQHEINNPLAALYGCLGLLMEQNPADSDQGQIARTAMQQAERITQVVQQLTDYRGGSTVEPVPGVSMLDLRPATTPEIDDEAEPATDAAEPSRVAR